jgi:hypothetical protein
MKSKGIWWARLDSNQGPTDYESAERGSFFSSNSQKIRGFLFPEHPNFTETDPYPNRITPCLATEPPNLNNSNGFLATEIRTNADPLRRFSKQAIENEFFIEEVVLKWEKVRVIREVEILSIRKYK